MYIPHVPIEAVLQLEQFVASCLDSGGCAVRDGAEQHIQLDNLQSLQNLLQDLCGTASPGLVPVITDSCTQPSCGGHPLHDLASARDHAAVTTTASVPFEPLAPVALNGRPTASEQRGSHKGAAHQRGSDVMEAYRDTGNGDTRPVTGSAHFSDGFWPFRPWRAYRSSDLSRMPDSDDAMFSSFMETLEFVNPSDYPFGFPRRLRPDASFRSDSSSTRLRSSSRACGPRSSSKAAAIGELPVPATSVSAQGPSIAPSMLPLVPWATRTESFADNRRQCLTPEESVASACLQQAESEVDAVSGPTPSLLLLDAPHQVRRLSDSAALDDIAVNQEGSAMGLMLSSNAHDVERPHEDDRHHDENSGQVCYNTEQLQVPLATWNKVLASIDSWQQFDVSSVAEQTCAPLRVISLAAFEALGLLKSLDIPRGQLQRYLQLIESLYPRSNPYHNSTHAADVVQALTCMLLKDHLVCRFSDLEVLAMLIAAVVHDVGHPGVTNQFLRASKDDLGFMFSNKSVAENASLAIGLGLLANPLCNFLSHMDSETVTSVESMTINLVLNTDMMFHLTIIDDAERHALRTSEEDLSSESPAERHGSSGGQHGSRWHDAGFRAAAMSLLIHAADINSAGRRPAVAGMWAKAIYDEFFRQGDLETEQELPQTPFFQREKVVIWTAQVSFAEKVVAPVFKALASLAPISAQIVLDNIKGNVQKWKELGNADASPVCVLSEPGTSTPKQLFVHCGEAVCKKGTRQPAMKPLLLVYSKGISAYLAERPSDVC